jgi:hypothetical protein
MYMLEGLLFVTESASENKQNEPLVQSTNVPLMHNHKGGDLSDEHRRVIGQCNQSLV